MSSANQQLLPARFQFLGRDPLFYGGVAAIVGVVLAHCLESPPLVWLGATVALLVVAATWKGGRALVLLAMLTAFAAIHEFREVRVDQISSIWDEEEQFHATVEGTVVATPRPPRKGRRWRLTVQLDSIKADELKFGIHNRIHVYTPDFSARQGDRIVADGSLSPLPAPRNPEEFSRQDYARDSEGVVGEMSVSSRFRLRVIGTDWRYRIFHHAFQTRNAFGRAITRGLDPRSMEAQILKAMVLGARDEADPEIEEPFRLSGALHIFAVSGLHVGIFGTVIWFLLRVANVPRRPAIAIIIVCVLGYAFITGLRPSAVRAAIMTSVFLAGFCLRRRSRLLNSLGFAALCILAIDSRQLFGVGFQLSFAVLTAISLLTPPLSRMSARWLSPDPFIPNSLVGKGHRLAIQGGRRAFDIVWVSLAASLGSAGFIWWYFGLLTPIAVLANCALVPIAWCVICLATVSLVFSPWPYVSLISTWLNQVNSHLVLGLHGIAAFFAQVPNGHFEVTPLSDHFQGKPAEPGMVVFDLGRSCGPQVIHLKDGVSGRARTWLIDSGDEARYARVIRPWLRANQIGRLDGFFATHGDIDHLGAAPSLMQDFKPLQLIQTQLTSTSKAYKALEEFKIRDDLSALQLSGGARIQLNEHASIDVLYPPPGYPDQSTGDDECLVFMVEWRGFRILNMSDSGFRTEKWLLENSARENLRADVLVKSQHTADFSGLAEFVLAVDPRAVIATNDHFPAGEAIADSWRMLLVERLEIPLFDQAECGAVSFTLDNEELKLTGFVNGQSVTLPPREPKR